MRSLLALSLLCAPALAAAQARTPVTQTAEVSSGEVFGGAITARVLVGPPEPFHPAVRNGVAESGSSDLRLVLDYHYRVKEQLGGKNEGEFVPYQTITVRIENLTTTEPENTVEFALHPAVSVAQGWHYASEVRLPPVNAETDLLSDQFRITVTSSSLGSVSIRSDALPASALFRPPAGEVVLLYDGELDLATARRAPRPAPGGPALPHHSARHTPAALPTPRREGRR